MGVNSGTDALILALKLLGVGQGDEVIVPAFSFISSASCVPWVGATPVFADITESDYALDADRVEEKITPKTKAIILVHLFGQPALASERICAVARERGIAVIEDAAQSFGAKIRIGDTWRFAGTLGDIGCLSFSSTKPFAAPGSGGAVIFNKRVEFLRDEADRMRFYGARTHYHDYPTVGVNSKLQDIQAAALLAKLPFLEHWFEHRKALTDIYTARLGGGARVRVPETHAETQRTWYRYIVRTEQRDALFERLIQKANRATRLIPSRNYPVPLPRFEMFQPYVREANLHIPVADTLSQRVISLPITNYVSKKDAEAIAASVIEFFA
jgi:dTDP-4-amino-4,6-dideoxygalactose transaminase